MATHGPSEPKTKKEVCARMLRKARLAKLAGTTVLLSTLAGAHDLWINATRYFVDPRRPRATVYIGWGHRFPADDIPRPGLIKGAWLVSPDGQKAELALSKEGLRATSVKFDREGSYILAVDGPSGFYTMALGKGGELHHILGPKTEAKGRVLLSLYYEKYAKALVTVGRGNENFSRIVGQRMEIVPLSDPARLKVGDFLPIKVLFEGKPASFCWVFATHAGFSVDQDAYAYATRTGLDGTARIRLTHPGQWLVKARLMRPPSPDKRGKCDWEAYTATLTFALR
ncbi:MAG TPA: DUF4198 domain-containing protein [Armatimonadetes bacterium]|nr:DUF4198 domain-containing protein [Armatimonadota bacterium]